MAPGLAVGARKLHEDEDKEDEEEAPSHLPFAPASELSDTSTTVDPSYIISLIRQLLPHNVRVENESKKIENVVQPIQAEMCCIEQSMTRDSNCRERRMASGSCEDLALYRNLTDGYRDKVDNAFIDQNGEQEGNDRSDDERTGVSDIKDPWEDSGCILWDLSASITHAEFMVNNLLLEVLVANLRISKSLRVTEICLGIFANLACHNVLSNAIVSTNGLIETVVDQLFLDDSTCLSETFRLLDAVLQGSEFAYWAKALLPEQNLLRVLWIIENTLNPVLLEKSIEFLLTIIDNNDVASILLQPLINLGLPNLVFSLLSCEISKIGDENKLERSSFLEVILRLIEALSTVDNFEQMNFPKKELLHLLCGIIKLPDKIEIASSCISAIVIIATIITNDRHLASELPQDIQFFQDLLSIDDFVSEDLPAHNALFCIVVRLLDQVKDHATLNQFVSLFSEKFPEEDLEVWIKTPNIP